MTICKNCGEEIVKYFRNGVQIVWKHKESRKVYCFNSIKGQPKAIPKKEV